MFIMRTADCPNFTSNSNWWNPPDNTFAKEWRTIRQRQHGLIARGEACRREQDIVGIGLGIDIADEVGPPVLPRESDRAGPVANGEAIDRLECHSGFTRQSVEQPREKGFPKRDRAGLAAIRRGKPARGADKHRDGMHGNPDSGRGAQPVRLDLLPLPEAPDGIADGEPQNALQDDGKPGEAGGDLGRNLAFQRGGVRSAYHMRCEQQRHADETEPAGARLEQQPQPAGRCEHGAEPPDLPGFKRGRSTPRKFRREPCRRRETEGEEGSGRIGKGGLRRDVRAGCQHDADQEEGEADRGADRDKRGEGCARQPILRFPAFVLAMGMVGARSYFGRCILMRMGEMKNRGSLLREGRHDPRCRLEGRSGFPGILKGFRLENERGRGEMLKDSHEKAGTKPGQQADRDETIDHGIFLSGRES